jgi:uncharacterized C2H2 Zn-finger protein
MERTSEAKRYVPAPGEVVVQCPHCDVYGIEGRTMERHVERCRLGLPFGWAMQREAVTP